MNAMRKKTPAIPTQSQPPMPVAAPAPCQPPTSAAPLLVDRMSEYRETLLRAREQLRLQINGVENQLFCLDHLMADPEPAPEEPTAPAPLPPGTI